MRFPRTIGLTSPHPMSFFPRHPVSVPIERARVLNRLSFVALALACVVALIAGYAGPAHTFDRLGTTFGLLSLASITTATIVLGVRTAAMRRDRVAWGCITFGVAAWGASSVAFAAFGRADTGAPVQLVDLGFLLFYPAMSIALGLMVRARVVHFFRASWLDGLIAFTGAAALCIAAAVEWILPSGGPAAYLEGNAKYPFLDAVLLAQLLGGLALTRGRVDRAWGLLALGIALFAVADTAYVVLIAQEAAHPYVVSPIWVAGIQLIAAAAVSDRSDAIVRVHSSTAATLALPLTFAVATTAFLVAAAFIDVPATSVILAGVTLLLIIGRTGLTFRENLALSETKHLALTDDLTGLANRRHLVSALERLGRNRGPSGLLICDLDGFKFINDTLGHQAGDQILAEIGRRLQLLDGFGLIARLGGDEFAAIVPTPAGDASLRTAAHRWQKVFAEPVMIDGIALQVTGSVGGALAADGMAPGELLRHADVAMYTAKEDERTFEIYRAERDDHSPAQLRLAGELRSGLREGQLRIHYQPKVAVATGRLCGVEALVRWEHPRHGLIPPEQMLSIAQRAGLMRQVTSNVLDQALAQLAQWQAAGARLTMAVNLSISDLHDVDLPAEVGQLLRTHRIRGDQLVLEGHRGPRDGSPRARRRCRRRTSPSRDRDRARRLRCGSFLARLCPPPASRRAEDRQAVHDARRARRRRSGDRPRRRRTGPRARLEGRRRGCRDADRSAAPRRDRLRGSAGLPHLQAGSGRSDRPRAARPGAAAGAPERRPRPSRLSGPCAAPTQRPRITPAERRSLAENRRRPGAPRWHAPDMPRALLVLPITALVVVALAWSGALSFEVSYDAGEPPRERPATAPAVAPAPAAQRVPSDARSNAAVRAVTDVRSTAAAIAAGEVAGRRLVECVLKHGLADCHRATGIVDPRGAGAPLVAGSLDDYDPSWAARVAVVRVGGGVAAVAFDAESLGVGYVIGRDRVVNTVCFTPRGDCTQDSKAAAFLADDARLAAVARQTSKG